MTSRESDASDVFIDLSQHQHVPAPGHSTPHPSSESSQSQGQTSSRGSRNLNSSQLTTISSIDEGDVGSNQSIFEHINRLTEESQMSDNEAVSDNADARIDMAADESDVPHSVSRVALLTNDGAPNTGVPEV